MKRLKNHIPCIFLIILLILASFSTISYSKKSITEEKDDLIVLDYSFSFQEPRCTPIQILGQTFSHIDMPGTLLTGQKIGYPQIPVKPVKIMLPANTQYEEIHI